MTITHTSRVGFGFAAFALGLGVLTTLPALAYKGENLAKDAKITMAQARKIALKAHAGKITDAELETESGGSGLRFSFDIKNGAKTSEIGVDAKTGKVLENRMEGKNPD